MRGHGSLQQLLGKRVTAKKKPGQDEEAPSSSKRQNAGPAPGSREPSPAPAAAAGAGGQAKVTSYFRAQKSAAAACADAAGPAAAAVPQQRSSSRSSRERAPAAPPPPPATADAAASAPPPATPGPFVIHTRLVGRHRWSEHPIRPGVELVLAREPDNPADASAVLVCGRTVAGGAQPHGYLPAQVAAHLAPLLDERQVEVAVRLAAEGGAAGDGGGGGGGGPASAQESAGVAPGGSGGASLSRAGSGDNGRWRIELRASPLGGSPAVAAALHQAAAAAAACAQPSGDGGVVLTAAFEHILQQTRQHDLHLLDEREQAVLQHMEALPPPPKALLLRLLLRKRTWFSLAALGPYPEVPDARGAAAQLAAVGLLSWSHDAGADLHGLLLELPVPALRQVLGAVLPRNHPAVAAAAAADRYGDGSGAGGAGGGGGGGGGSKDALVAAIQSAPSRPRLQAAIGASAGTWCCVPPGVADTFSRLQLIYFLNPNQDLGMFLAVDRGALRYPPFAVSRAQRVFGSRQQLLDYRGALALAARVEGALEDGDHDGAWRLLQPSLAALRSGAHKAVVWAETHGASMPNPPPAAPAQQQQQQQQDGMQDWSPRPPRRSRSNTPRPRASRSRSRSPSPSSARHRRDSSSSGDSTSTSSHRSRPAGRSSSASGWSSSPAVRGARPGPAAGQADAGGGAGGGPTEPRPVAGLPADSAPPLFLARFSAGWVHAMLGTVAVSLLERRKDWGAAVGLLRLLLGGNACVGRRGDWWTRLAINLEHMGQAEEALEAAEAALADGWVRWGDRLGLQRRALRLGRPPRRWRRPSWAAAAEWEPREVVLSAMPLANSGGGKSRFYGWDGQQVTVEELALQHYASREGGGWRGLHSEGGVWSTLFALLLWDVVFTGVPDVFRSPFQAAPLDLDTDAFYPSRRDALDRQLSAVADGQAGEILAATWARHVGTMCRGVSWQRFGQQQLLEICECVGGLGLAAVLRLMAEDHAGAMGGLPDLLLWRPADRAARVVEVKGPRDRLSNQQCFWLAHMAEGTIDVEVCKVREPAQAPTARRR